MRNHYQKTSFEKMQQIFVHDKVEIVDGSGLLGRIISSDNAGKKFVKRSHQQLKW